MDIVHYKTANCQIITLGKPLRKKMVSKLAAESVFHSKRIGIAFIFILKPYGTLINLHQKDIQLTKLRAYLENLIYKWTLKGGNYMEKKTNLTIIL